MGQVHVPPLLRDPEGLITRLEAEPDLLGISQEEVTVRPCYRPGGRIDAPALHRYRCQIDQAVEDSHLVLAFLGETGRPDHGQQRTGQRGPVQRAEVLRTSS